MHVDAASSQELERAAKVSPAFAMTLHAAVWRGSNDDEAVASTMDQPDHLGQVWIAQAAALLAPTTIQKWSPTAASTLQSFVARLRVRSISERLDRSREATASAILRR